MGVTETEVVEAFTTAQLQKGLEEKERSQLLQTFITNNYNFHLQVNKVPINYD